MHHIDYILQVNTATPETASRNGGTAFTITGAGFVDGETQVFCYSSFCASLSRYLLTSICVKG